MKTRLERGKSMKKKKGFTLIELLAVIVILAIIALIAVPVVMNIISKANKSAFKDSAYGVLKAGENYYMGELLKAEGMTEDKMFNFSNGDTELEINGSKPTGGSMIVRKDGKIAMAIHNGKHCVTKGFEDDDVTITDDIENCGMRPKVNTLSELATIGTFESSYGASPVEVNEVHACAKSGVCEPGTAFAIKVNNEKTYKFYVLSDTGSEVTLIMDRNLCSEEDFANGTHNVAWISASDYNAANSEEGDNTVCNYDACNDEGPLTALAVLKIRTNSWTNIPSYMYVLEDDEDWKEVNNLYSKIEGELVTNVRARLPRYSEIEPLLDEHGFPPDYLIDNLDYEDYINKRWIYGYWFSTAASWSDYSSALIMYQTVDSLSVSSEKVIQENSIGLRPVITLSK